MTRAIDSVICTVIGIPMSILGGSGKAAVRGELISFLSAPRSYSGLIRVLVIRNPSS